MVDQVWVDDYVTSRGVRVAGHFRRHQHDTDLGTDGDGQPQAEAVEPQLRGTPGDKRRVQSVGLRQEPDAGTVSATSSSSGDGAGSGRCQMCGQYAGAGHVCPARPERLPAANYASMGGEQRVEAMLADLDQAVAAIVESGQLESWLNVMSSNGLNRWSANNRVLAMMQLMQRGDTLENVHLMGFKQWGAFDRQVTKGAKAVWILAPITRRFSLVDDDGTETEERRVVGFKAVPVFNIGDTTGAPMPAPPITAAAGEATPGTVEGLQDRVGRAGYAYSEEIIPGCRPASGEGTLGYTQPGTKQIVVDSRLSPAMKASTLAHELGHVHCGHVDAAAGEYGRHRGRMETEAEMTAYLVNRSRGMSRTQVDSFSPGYIASWSKGDPAVMRASVDTAVKAYNKIMEGQWPA